MCESWGFHVIDTLFHEKETISMEQKWKLTWLVT